MISAIGNAEQSIQLTNAYFVPEAQLLQALIDAAGRAHYAPLLQAGVRIYERRGAWLHAKAALIDGIWSCVG